MAIETIGEALKAIGRPMIMGAICLASTAMLALDQFHLLPEPLQPHQLWIWLAWFVSLSALAAHLVRYVTEEISKSRESAQKRKAADALMYRKYQDFDDDEKSVLKEFIDKHEKSLHISHVASNEQLHQAARRLINRGYLFTLGNEYNVSRSGKERVYMFDAHFEALVSKPSLVGSDAKPKSFG